MSKAITRHVYNPSTFIQKDMVITLRLEDLSNILKSQNLELDQKDFISSYNHLQFEELYNAVATNNINLVNKMDLTNIPLVYNDKSVVSAVIYSNKYSSLQERESMLNLLSKSGQKIDIDDISNIKTKSDLSYFYEQNFSYIDEEYMKKMFFDTLCTGDFDDMMDNV